MTGVRNPRWLRADFTERARPEPLRLRMVWRLNQPGAALMTLPPGEAPAPGDWMELYDPEGSAGYWRVRRREDRAGEEAGITLELEHGLALLGDTVLAPGFVTGGEARTDLTRALALQPEPRWTLGSCELPGLWGRDLSLRTALEALQQILADGGGVCRADMTRTPWVLHAERPAQTLCRCAEGRNLRSAMVTRDASGLCTRLYAYGAQGVTLADGYLDSAAAAHYGIRGGVLCDRTLTGQNTLLAAARRELARRDHLRESAVAEAIDLYPETREEADRFALGAPCRLAWGDAHLTADIVGIERPDLCAAPERVILTLGHPAERLTAVCADIARRLSVLERRITEDC